MDIHKEWEQLNHKLFSNQSLKHDEIMNAITSESSSAIAGIKKGLKIKSYWCLLFSTMFVFMMIYARSNVEAVIAIGVVAVIYIIGFFIIRAESNRLDPIVENADNVLSSLKQNAKVIKRALSLEKGIFLYTSPVILICGLLYGRFLKGETFNQLANDPEFLTLIITMSFIMVPAVFILGTYLTKKAFGAQMGELDDSINKLEGVEMLKEM